MNRYVEKSDDPDLDQESEWHIPARILELAGRCSSVFETCIGEEQQQRGLAEPAAGERFLSEGHPARNRENADRHEDHQGKELCQRKQDPGVDPGTNADDVDGRESDDG